MDLPQESENIENQPINYSLIIRALLPLLPQNDTICVHEWIEKLAFLSINSSDFVTIAEEYWTLLILFIQYKNILYPFTEPPPQEILPLMDVLSPNIYEKLKKVVENNNQWLSNLMKNSANSEYSFSGTSNVELVITGPPVLKHSDVDPHKFLESQPQIDEGIMCFMGAFSNRNP